MITCTEMVTERSSKLPLAVALKTMLPPKTVVIHALQAALTKHHHRIWLQHPGAAGHVGFKLCHASYGGDRGES
jgi:hypothetical protein